tara:strand:+ start:599 stop:904 length:306 start_codon:yes stop_codon:yes gene_type:complete
MNDSDKLLLQRALHELNNGAWYSWKKTNDDGSIIPNSERMQYKYLVKIIDSATMPTENQLNAKIQELKDAETDKENNKASGKTKLKNLGLNDDEIKALMGA